MARTLHRPGAELIAEAHMNRLATFVLIALSATGCATAPDASFEDDLAVDVDDPAGKEDGVTRPIGTFRVQDDANAPEDGIRELTLYTNNSFHITTVYRPRCNTRFDACEGIEDSNRGHYRLTKAGSSRYIRLESDTLYDLDRLRYSYSARSGTLSVTPVHEGVAGRQTQLTRDSAGGYCGDTLDCEILELDLAICSEDGEPAVSIEEAWTCVDSECIPKCLVDAPNAI